MSTFSTLTGLACSQTGDVISADQPRNLSAAGFPLLAQYDLEKAAGTLRRDALADRPMSMWRYHEVMPAPDANAIVSIGEGMTPLLPVPRLQSEIGVRQLWLKDEGRNPTGSFKDRGMSAALTMARAVSVERLVMPTAGNAGGSAAAYAANAGLPIHVYIPKSATPVNHFEAHHYGAEVTVVDGYLDECGRLAGVHATEHGAFEISTFKEPYRVEGKKTMAYELVEQMGGSLPDVIVYPTGGGTGLVAMWKAFDELEALGWIDSKRPRMISVQSTGCAPIVKAFDAGTETAEHWQEVSTHISGLTAPRVFADRLCLRAIRESHGTAIALPDDVAIEFARHGAALEGVSLCPEGGMCLAALSELVNRGDVDKDERVVVFNTANANKYTDLLG